MADERALTRYESTSSPESLATPPPNYVLIEAAHLESWNALYREHQRFRQQITQMQAVTYNNHKIHQNLLAQHQQLVTQYNTAQAALRSSHQVIQESRAQLDQEQAAVAYGKQAMDHATYALQQADEQSQHQLKKEKTLIAIITKLNIVPAEDLNVILENGVDVTAIFNSPSPGNSGSNPEAALIQTSFTLDCYKGLLEHKQGEIAQLKDWLNASNLENEELRAEFVGHCFSGSEDSSPDQEAA